MGWEARFQVGRKTGKGKGKAMGSARRWDVEDENRRHLGRQQDLQPKKPE